MGFWDDITPEADFIVKVCLGNTCRPQDSRAILKTIEDTLGIRAGELTPDKRFYLEVQLCFGQCGKGPNILVNKTLHHEMTPEKAIELVQSLAQSGDQGNVQQD